MTAPKFNTGIQPSPALIMKKKEEILRGKEEEVLTRERIRSFLKDKIGGQN